MNTTALEGLRKWESEIQFMNLIRQIHERGTLYKQKHGEEQFNKMLANLPDDTYSIAWIFMLSMLVVMMAAVTGFMLAVLYY